MHLQWPTYEVKIFLIYESTYELETLKSLKEIAVSSISTAEDINDAVHVIADNRVGICPFNVNENNDADTLLSHVLRR